MGSRRDRRGYRRWASDLRVEEVIVPVKNDEDAGPSKDVRSQTDHECTHTITQSSMKLGEHEITAFCGLVVLQKPSVEGSVLATQKKKKYRKRKTQRNQYYSKDDSTYCNLFVKTNVAETFHPGNEIVRDFPRTSETLEERLLKGNIERKIQSYENWMKQQQEKNYKRQRHLEKQSLEKQENLAETWLGFIERKKELRKKNLEENSPPLLCKHRQFNRPLSISLISKKYWNDETGVSVRKQGHSFSDTEISSEKTPVKFVKPEKGEEQEKGSALDELKDEFFEKLVFVDDSDSDSG